MNAEELNGKIVQVYRERDRKIANLRPGGKPYLLPEEEAKRRDQYEQEARDQVARIVEQGRTALERSEQAIYRSMAALKADPIEQLGTADLQRAAALRPFVEE